MTLSLVRPTRLQKRFNLCLGFLQVIRDVTLHCDVEDHIACANLHRKNTYIFDSSISSQSTHLWSRSSKLLATILILMGILYERILHHRSPSAQQSPYYTITLMVFRPCELSSNKLHINKSLLTENTSTSTRKQVNNPPPFLSPL